MDIQNLSCYGKISGLPNEERNRLCIDVDRDSVIDLKYPDALTTGMLDEILTAKYFLVCNELGEIHEYDWLL